MSQGVPLLPAVCLHVTCRDSFTFTFTVIVLHSAHWLGFSCFRPSQKIVRVSSYNYCFV